jgi:hypothetical protein
MPVELKYYDNDSGVLFIGKGVITGRELIEATKIHYYDKERMKLYRYGLCDYINVDGVEVSRQEIETLVQMNVSAADIIRDGVVAIVAKDNLAFGLIRMFQIMMDKLNWELHTSRSRDENILWLTEKVREKFDFELTME